ncbi:MFS general substrate transporter [Leucogyrophana mollusca]|uniref:MFS general substrate transporter n=1 Tax=Leucogyrophana mollusca TaxID=85980 RepID=A0ACB8BRN3_9AGAM|nr:MFS general substrate transporter [Leucogyrophana mollusca]
MALEQAIHVDCEPKEDSQLAADASISRQRNTPLPKLQLFVLLYVQLAEPITSTVIYPFVNQLVRETGITGGDERKTGYFAGLIESLFYATEAVTVLQWGRASDNIGRKPIILVGLFGLALSMMSFGVSKQFWAVVLSRCIEGALNGNVGVVKSTMAEITDPSNMAQGFAFLPMIWSVGATLGPIIGGILARPADTWPRTFKEFPFFRKYPYFLPCLVTACVSLSAFVLTLCCLKESANSSEVDKNQTSSRALNRRRKNNATSVPQARTGHLATSAEANLTNSPETELGVSSPAYTGEKPSSSLRALLVPRVVVPIINYAFLAFIDQCLVVLQPLMYSTSLQLGGLSFSSFTIGIILGVWGVINGIIQIVAFPKLLQRFGPRKLYTVAFGCYLVTIAAFPLMGFLAKRKGRIDASVWAVLILQLAAYLAAYNGYGCIFIFINDGAPSREALGATNGLAQTTASVMRAIAPSVASPLFSLSLEKNIANGTAVYWILCAIILAGPGASIRSVATHWELGSGGTVAYLL